MNKDDILKKAQQQKCIVGEMEKVKINKSCWVANVVAVIVSTAFMITLGALGCFAGLYAIATVCFTWASVFYFCQYFLAKRPWQVLIGAILDSIGAIIMFVFFILYSIGVL